MSGASASQRTARRRIIATAVIALSLSASTGSALGHSDHGHPARIHEGSCENVGRVAYRLNGVGGSVNLDNAPIAAPAEVNPDQAYEVMLSNTVIDGSLDDLLAGDYAVTIYESDDEMQSISCGNLGGVMNGETFIMGLGEAGQSGYLGFATFTSTGDQTEVELILGNDLAPRTAGAATAVPDDAGDGHADADSTDHDDAEEEGHDVAATPES